MIRRGASYQEALEISDLLPNPVPKAMTTFLYVQSCLHAEEKYESAIKCLRSMDPVILVEVAERILAGCMHAADVKEVRSLFIALFKSRIYHSLFVSKEHLSPSQNHFLLRPTPSHIAATAMIVKIQVTAMIFLERFIFSSVSSFIGISNLSSKLCCLGFCILILSSLCSPTSLIINETKYYY